jgi:SAM-dependent methyltransferase
LSHLPTLRVAILAGLILCLSGHGGMSAARASPADAAQASSIAVAPTVAAPAAAPTVAMPTDTAPAYREGRGTIDGIGKFYYGREIAHVMGFEGAEWLERPSREQEERTDLLIAQLNLKSGMTVADIGAGSGYLSRRMAPHVSPGKVYAVDVQPEMVAMLTKVSHEPGMSNLIPVQGALRDVGLPSSSVDLAIMVDVYHELEFPYEVMQSIVRALKPAGLVVFVEYRGEDPAVPIKTLHKMSEAQVKREMRALPLDWVRTSEVLPIQHIIVFRRR